MRPIRRQGFAIYLVVGMLMFGAVMSYGLNYLMLQQSAAGHLSGQRAMALSLSSSLLALASSTLAVQLNDPTSPLFGQLAGQRGSPVPLVPGTDITPTSLTPAGSSASIQGICQAFPSASGKISITVVSATSLNQAAQVPYCGNDPLEQIYTVKFTIDATCGGISRHIEVTKNIRFQNLVPLALTKFTLWAGQLTPSNPNYLRTDFAGSPLAGSPLPLVLHNEGVVPNYSTSQTTYQSEGYVYLGGSNSGGCTTLHLTAGYSNLGELFTFLQVPALSSPPPTRVPAMEPTALPGFFSGPQGPGPSPNTQLLYHVVEMIYGYFSGTDSAGRTLTQFIPQDPTPASSVLHLYGDWASPSATLVLGNVSRAYPIVSATLCEVVTKDASGNWTVGDGIDGLVTLMPRRDLTLDYPNGLPAIPNPGNPVMGLPSSTYAGQPIPLIPVPTWDGPGGMFPSTPATSPVSSPIYDSLASLVQGEPYVAGYNYLYRTDSAMTLAPPSPYFPGFQDALTLPAGSITPIFNGNASGLGTLLTNPDDPTGGINTILRSRAIYRVADQSQLLESFSTATGLRLGAPILLSQPDDTVDLGNGSPVTIASGGGGMVILDSKNKSTPSNILLHGLTSNDPAFGLILCPMKGNCIVDFSASSPTNPLPFSVVAPAGTLQSFAGSPSATIEGSLVLQTLDLTQLQGGGDLYYDVRQDLTAATYPSLYRAYISDDEASW